MPRFVSPLSGRTAAAVALPENTGLRAHLAFAASLLEGCLLAALGLVILRASGLLISGMAGFTMLLERAVPLSFGTLFISANIPFYLLAVWGMGWRFTLRTVAAVSMLGLLTDLLSANLALQVENPAAGALAGGALIGSGLVILLRAGASLGGVNILAVYFERCLAIHPGVTTLAADLLIVLLALTVLEPTDVATSMLGFVTLSLLLGRYRRQSAVLRHADPTT